MVNIEKTIQSLQKKFKPGEFEKRRIVIWYDKKNTLKEEDYKELIEGLEENNIKFHILNDNYFETKKLLEKDDIDSNYLIYSKENAPVDQSNWLLDIQLYSQTFETSEVSVIKSELEIDTHIFDDFLELHSKFFNNKLRTALLKSLYQKNWGEEQFILGFLAVLSSLDRLDFNKILRNIFCNSLDQDENTIYNEIKKYPLEEPFWKLVKNQFGYSLDHPTLDKLFLSLILTHIKNKTTIEFHKSDEEYINKNKSESEIFIQDWMDDPKYSNKYYLYAREFTKKILSKDEILHTDIYSELEKHPVVEFIEAESIDIFDKLIIKRIADDLIDHKQEYDSYLEWIGKRKQKHWYIIGFKNLYNALEFGIKLNQFDQKHTAQDKKPLKDLFNSYKETLYQMDFFYRKFYFHIDKEPEKDILKKLQPEIENLYNNKLLDNFLTAWSDAINHELDDTWDIESLDKQSKFFNKYVKRIIDKNDRDKVAVIISDAMRYEVAEELKNVLNKETKGTVDLSAMLGVIPSYTKLGMACLLPHESLEYKDDKILVDKINSSGIENRDKILSQAFTDSIAINFEELMSASRDDAREKIKGKRIIYIYHNTIDSIGDDKKSEIKVFNAVEETIEDLEKMIRRLSYSLSVTNIIITADHGFIYKRETLDSADKLESITFDKMETKEAGKRFILSNQDISLKNVHKFNMKSVFENTPDMFIYVPYGDLRFKQKGGGANFVHGGLSPQEIVIPVLSYHHLRDIKTLDKKRIKHGKVKVSVINSSRKITNNTFIVIILQTEKITDKLLPLKFKVALWDLDEEPPIKVSDEKLVIADKTSDKPEERQIKITLTLGTQVKNKKYYLRLIDEDPKAFKKEIDQIPFDVDLAISRDFGDI